MEIKHDNPALLLEWFKVSVCLTNLEDRPVSDVCLNLSLDRNNNEKVELMSKCLKSYETGEILLPYIIVDAQYLQLKYVKIQIKVYYHYQ